MSTEDVGKTIRTINGAQKAGYSVDKIVNALSSWDAYSVIQAELEKNVENLTVQKDKLQEEYDRLSDSVLIHKQKLSICEKLEGMGFGLKQLKLLYGTIMELATANNIAPDLAVGKFFQDIEKNYDNKLGFESKLMALKSEISKTNNELIIIQNNLAYKNQVAKALSELISIGFNDQQILNLAWALQSNTRNKESLEADLKKYGNSKSQLKD
jgi:DNA-binding transcriptional MerR regulator